MLIIYEKFLIDDEIIYVSTLIGFWLRNGFFACATLQNVLEMEVRLVSFNRWTSLVRLGSLLLLALYDWILRKFVARNASQLDAQLLLYGSKCDLQTFQHSLGQHINRFKLVQHRTQVFLRFANVDADCVKHEEELITLKDRPAVGHA